MAEQVPLTKQETAVFQSKFSNLQMRVKPGGWDTDPQGRRSIIPGKMIRFESGKYSTSDPQEIEFIRNCPEYGFAVFEDSPEYQDRLAKKMAAMKKGK